MWWLVIWILPMSPPLSTALLKIWSRTFSREMGSVLEQENWEKCLSCCQMKGRYLMHLLNYIFFKCWTLLINAYTKRNISWFENLHFCFYLIQMKQLVGFKGDPSALPEADLFMLMLIKMPRLANTSINAILWGFIDMKIWIHIEI